MENALLMVVALAPLIVLSGCVEEPQDMNCRDYCETQPHVEGEGNWTVSGTYPDCVCNFECTKEPNECADETDTETRGRCFSKLAQETRDKEICTQVEDTYWRGECYHSATTSILGCEDIEDVEILHYTMLDCMLWLNRGTGPFPCEHEEEYKQVQCLVYDAVKNGNKVACDIIEQSKIRAACKEMAK